VIRRGDKVCIITDIGFDHTNVLGDTLGKIAAQKAGIIQPHNYVFMYTQTDEVMSVVRATALRQAAELHELTQPERPPGYSRNLPLFQQRNFYLAEQAVKYVLQRDGRPALSPAQLAEAAGTYIPGRMEIFQLQGKTLVLDGAHNGQKMAALLASLRAKFPGARPAVMAAFVGTRDDRWQHALDELADYTDTIIATTFNHESDELPKNGMPAEDIADYLRGHGKRCEIKPDLVEAFRMLLACPESLLLVTGSLYPLEDVRQLAQKQ
jgi:dihydrofolate synthase/folylpolyglutamate synthase